MKKLIVILLLLVCIGFLSGCASEAKLREKIGDYYYAEMSKEGCGGNQPNPPFSTIEECKNAVRCVSSELSRLIPADDLKDLAKQMAKGTRAESAVISYMQGNSSIKQQFDSRLGACFT